MTHYNTVYLNNTEPTELSSQSRWCAAEYQCALLLCIFYFIQMLPIKYCQYVILTMSQKGKELLVVTNPQLQFPSRLRNFVESFSSLFWLLHTTLLFAVINLDSSCSKLSEKNFK